MFVIVPIGAAGASILIIIIARVVAADAGDGAFISIWLCGRVVVAR